MTATGMLRPMLRPALLLLAFVALPAAAPVVRAGLCSLAQPSLRQARHTPRFLFHEACLLLVAAGRLDLHDGSHQTTVDTPSCLLLVQAHTSADLMKTPGSGGQPFRSVLLALSPELLEAFHRTRAQPAALPQDEQAFRQLPLDDDLQDALRQVLASVPSPTLSDERLRYRLMDLLAALAERGEPLAELGVVLDRRPLGDLQHDGAGDLAGAPGLA